MRYEGNIYRPPSEARSYLLQVTIGCAHNDCTFCNMFKDKTFRVRPEAEVFEDLEQARKTYRNVEKIFLCDGDAMCLATDRLLRILDVIARDFPECRQVSVYGAPQDILRKTEEDLARLKEAGIGIIYIGGESGSDLILSDVKKGATREEIIEAIKKIETAGIAASVTFISGLGGREKWREHAEETASMINLSEPTYVGLLTLMLERGAPLTEEVKSGHFQLMSPEEIIGETLLMLEKINVEKECVFRSNHASNYVSLRGTLPQDKNKMIEELRRAMVETGMIKDERFRML